MVRRRGTGAARSGRCGAGRLAILYAAAELATKALETLWLATLLVVVYDGMVSRWVLVNRRTLSFRQRRERAQAEEGETLEPAPNLGQIDAQTRRLIRTLTTVGALGGTWFVWSDMFPALTVLDRVVLWPMGAEPGTEGAFTLEHLGLTLILGVLTAALARNVPALLEMLLLRLPINPGSRYALTSISRYALVFSGTLAIFGVLGVTWSSVQWLVAAVSVGLGFGLQGDLRELRLGVVVAGRAAGARRRHDHRRWRDRNGDTDPHSRDDDPGLGPQGTRGSEQGPGDRPPLLNWTLSDAANRVTAFVGVAYGSRRGTGDTRAARDRGRPPLVLETPEPMVTFEEFGDSALKFCVRAYVRGVEERLPAIHALHTAIARRFGEEDIEIAFPQMDIHVR